ncbi:MAG TPA: hypothetical protein VIL63_00675 [Terriglobales bacterium]|jgi:hypothetical protein
MADVDDKKHEYGEYAEHCLHTLRMMPSQKSRTLQREMAAEWLRLADSLLSELPQR